ncbi:COMM domain-containing protein 7 isoform X1 [Mustela lutreola]|uniref:COMM domain-containing protein 7 isoform X1 n=1 Tax=Mustela lutreola TaxID=9666 RepID=UPI002796F57D|nr:COMM domain-containing protein 7 isoform X1 [Mustela lutreola]
MGRLHCTEDPVPEAVGGDMQQLNQLGAQQFSALTEVLFHFLTEPKEVERFLSQLSEFATTNQISLGPLRSIVKSLLLVPNGALKKSLTADQVRGDLITLVSFCSLIGLSEEKATYFSEKWKQSAPTLARWAIGQTLMINQLVDMEWKFGVTSGSSELEKVGSIFLQLKLVVKKGNQTENLYIVSSMPSVGLELTALRSRVMCSTDRTSQASPDQGVLRDGDLDRIHPSRTIYYTDFIYLREREIVRESTSPCGGRGRSRLHAEQGARGFGTQSRTLRS